MLLIQKQMFSAPKSMSETLKKGRILHICETFILFGKLLHGNHSAFYSLDYSGLDLNSEPQYLDLWDVWTKLFQWY